MKDWIWKFLIIIFILFYAILLAIKMNDFEEKKMECIKKFGGDVERGHCIYTQEGNSKSYNIWEKDAKGGKSE